MSKKIRGEYGWLTMAIGIVAYDLWAIKTKRAETLSAAMWRSLEHPKKSPFVLLSWFILTHHLLFNKNARNSHATVYKTLKVKYIMERK